MNYVTYKELSVVYGKRAYEALLLLERSAKIKRDNIVSVDCEKRLRCALDAMRETKQAA